MPASSSGSSGSDEAAARLRESLYTAVGFGVLGFQQAQVRRRQLQRELSRLATEFDERVEPVLDDLQARLSDEMAPLVAQARSAVRTFFGPPPPGGE